MKDYVYELAVQLRKANPWKKLLESNLFAIQLPQGEFGYCCIMGEIGEHLDLSVYLGQRGLTSVREIVEADDKMMDIADIAMHQDCLQCSFENSAYLTDAERKEAQAFAKRTGISFRGKKAFPSFVRYRPYHMPTAIETEAEQEVMGKALQAALYFCEALETKTKEELGFCYDIDEGARIPLLQMEQDEFRLQTTELPASVQEVNPRPRLENEIAAAKIRKAKKSGTWQCQVYRMQEPVRLEKDELPCFPMALMVVDSATEFVFPIYMVDEYEERAGRLINRLAEIMLDKDAYPKTIQVKDNQTQALLEHFCEQTNIQLKQCKRLPVLEKSKKMMDQSLDQDSEDMIQQLIQMLQEMDSEDIENLPEEMRQAIVLLSMTGDLPDDLSLKFGLVPADGDDAGAKIPMTLVQEQEEQSFVISVSLGKGCYRHIQISENATFYDLHEAILDAFGFDDDHAHVFFMDNRWWSPFGQICSADAIDEDEDEDTLASDECVLYGLKKGQAFKYLFDFGYEWRFQCKVLRVIDKQTEYARVIKQVGEAPAQYPDWDDD